MVLKNHGLKTNADKYFIAAVLYILSFVATTQAHAATKEADRAGLIIFTNGKSLEGKVKENNDGTVTLKDKQFFITLSETDIIKIIYSKKHIPSTAGSGLNNEDHVIKRPSTEEGKTDNGLENGTITDQRKETIGNIVKHAEQGDSTAQRQLGEMYVIGEGVRQDFSESLKWFRKAADQGDTDAQYNLGLLYLKGEGVHQDHTEAAKWFQKAAEKGLAPAQDTLGLLFACGKGVYQDYAEAAKWFQKAAKQWHSSAQYNLGLLYDYGKGVAQDHTEAIKWFQKAAEQGHEKAKALLKNSNT